MLDFLMISYRHDRKGIAEVFPKFKAVKTTDLMIRGSDFYAVWVEEKKLWSTDEQDALDLIDKELEDYANANRDKLGQEVKVLNMWDADTGMIDKWHKYCQKQMRDTFHMLDETLIFSNMETTKTDYATKKLPYPLEYNEAPSYDRLMSVLYSEEERHKIEWAIGAIVTGDSKTIQKFLVLYGAAGTGKSTVLNIIQMLFEGYYSVFDAKALGSSNNAFALEAFKTNPLIAIQHDGDLSHIEDNTRLNSLVSHEMMTVNEKFRSAYSTKFKSFLFMGTNKPVRITDGKSGLLRRLIDVSPSGNKVSVSEYDYIMNQIKFELGSIAGHCQNVYLSNKSYYDGYIPKAMMGASNDFYNFVIESFHVFKKEDGTTLKAAWEMYNTYCDEAHVPYPYSKKNFKEELKNYFWNFKERVINDDGSRIRSYYSGFRTDIFEEELNDGYEHKVDSTKETKQAEFGDSFKEQPSQFDKDAASYPAQYANSNGSPTRKWDGVTTTLSDLDTSKLHYVKVPENHIVIDFDLKDEKGEKSYAKNVAAASAWPPTYAELSKSGAGIHLHYLYSGDPSTLSHIYADNIEVKVFTGNSSLRRMLTKCNDLPIATLSSGLPLREEKKMINKDVMQTEKGLRTTIKKCISKEIHADTRSNVDFIFKILEDYYNSGEHYDVTDMKNSVYAFATQSTNQAEYCIKLVNKMKFKSDDVSEPVDSEKELIVFYDVEVFPNLFLVCWKLQGKGNPVVKMFNPKPREIEDLLNYRIIGFNNRRYDNHLLYGCLIGYTPEQLYDLSQHIINTPKGEQSKYLFGEAYNLSYTDVYDFAAKKQSLKKWEIELGIHHQELGLPWDEPVPKERWEEVGGYCENDVIATEAVFDHLQGDWTARQILADLADLSPNSTTNALTTRIIFGKEKNPHLVYTDLATGEQFGNTHKSTANNKFPGYEFVYSDEDNRPHNMYRDTDVGFGGYVYAEPGIYVDVALLDIQSLHPNSIVQMEAFGEYTERFKDILDARVFIKHGDYDSVRHMFDGKLKKYLDDESTAKDLAQALKIAINSVYGLTSANFANPFRDTRNKNNIVALRGALFMRTLQDEVTNRGFKVAHIKTDSIKIPNATPEIIKFCMDFAKYYGYIFEHEATYDRMCLVNDAVYIAKYKKADWCEQTYGYVPGDNKKHGGDWTATGKQFQIPYVFKKLFSKEDILFEDLCETKEVKTAIYLDMNEKLPEDEHSYQFIGKVGLFCPIKAGCNGGRLVRENTDKEGNKKYDSVTGAKDYRWLESEMVKQFGKEDDIDMSYFTKLADDAIDAISKYGNFYWFVSEDPYEGPLWMPEDDDTPPWEESTSSTPFDVR